MIDAAAVGDIDAPTPSPDLLKTAFSLASHRYDWWASASNSPWPSVATDVLSALAIHPIAEEKAASSTPIPWENLDSTVQVSHVILHLSPAQIDNIRDAAPIITP